MPLRVKSVDRMSLQSYQLVFVKVPSIKYSNWVKLDGERLVDKSIMMYKIWFQTI